MGLGPQFCHSYIYFKERDVNMWSSKTRNYERSIRSKKRILPMKGGGDEK